MTNSNTAPLVLAYMLAKANEETAKQDVAKARKAILATGMDIIEGMTADVIVTMSERKTIDSDAVKALLGDNTPYKIAAVETLRVKAKCA
jgi:hypothetical protein